MNTSCPWFDAPQAIYAIDGIVCWPAHRYGPAPEAFHPPPLLLGGLEPGTPGHATLLAVVDEGLPLMRCESYAAPRPLLSARER
jgi:hypothetical protein